MTVKILSRSDRHGLSNSSLGAERRQKADASQLYQGLSLHLTNRDLVEFFKPRFRIQGLME